MSYADVDGRKSVDEIAPEKKFRSVRRFCKNYPAVASVVFIACVTFVCTLPSLFTKYQQNQIDPTAEKLPPSGAHWFGTDKLGRDQFTEVLHAGLVSLRIGIMVAIISTAIGAVLGAFAGYKRGFFDSIIMRTTDLFLCIPQLVILGIALKKYGAHGDLMIAFIESLVFWPSIARYVRGHVISLRTREYVDAAKISGRGTFYIVTRQLIPNSWSIIAVSSAIAVANAISLETTLSFLGFGVQPPKKSLGQLMDAASGSLSTHFNLFFAPGLTVVLIVLAFFFIGDGLRDALDPRSDNS